MLRLLKAAGFEPTDLAYRQVEAEGDLVLVLAPGLRKLIEMAREQSG